ncbi:MAG TPA: HAD-IA family hydrolase [Gaiellaceae bacterium]|nr:HAD-IA family hydrolase [Gaiellaceae bacterium]
MRYETVLFDLDGTLIDSGAAILASFHHATQTVLGRRYEDDVIMASVGGHGIHRQMAAFDEDRVDDLVAAYRAHNMELYRDIRLFPGIEPVLARLRDSGRRLGIVTVKSRVTVDLTFELLPLGDYFDVVVNGDDVAEHKPHPAALLLALDEYGAPAETAAYVGDSPFDLQAARAAGVGAIGVAWGGIHGRDRLEPEHPDALVDRPEELLGVL